MAKYQIGEKVRFLKDPSGYRPHRIGQIATVLEDDGEDKLPVKINFGGDDEYDAIWVNYDEIAPVDAGLFIVITEINGKLAPATTPRTYKSESVARHVTEDMAKKHGGKFYVFRATFEAVANAVTTREL